MRTDRKLSLDLYFDKTSRFAKDRFAITLNELSTLTYYIIISSGDLNCSAVRRASHFLWYNLGFVCFRTSELVALMAISTTLFLFLHTRDLHTKLKEMEVKLTNPDDLSSNQISGKFRLRTLSGQELRPVGADDDPRDTSFQFLRPRLTVLLAQDDMTIHVKCSILTEFCPASSHHFLAQIDGN